MARSLRIEFPGALYHVISRCYQRQTVFADEVTHELFEQCLFEACERNGWGLEAFCVMPDHYHLVLRTPMGNLSEGMRWLQSAFANRLKRMRGKSRRLFQGRFKSLIVDETDYLGALLDFVHLNPVRADLVSVEHLFDYRWSSYYYLWNPEKRPAALQVAATVLATRGCEDSFFGRREYGGHLAWLVQTPVAQEEAGFSRLSRGWVVGSKAFKRSLAARVEKTATPGSSLPRVHLEGADPAAANREWWEHCLQRCLKETGASLETAGDTPKSDEWKVLIAAVLKSRTSAPNSWISERLHMGVPAAVSRHVKIFLDRGQMERDRVNALISKITE